MQKSLFGTSGIRGDAEELFTNQFAFDLGLTFAKFLDNNNVYGGIAVGRDPRVSSPRISKALESGLVYGGRMVFDEGVSPVPSINNILLTDSQYAGSVMVSGSHIQPKLNGVKFFFNKEEILKSHEKEIEKIYSDLSGDVKFKDFSNGINIESRASDSYCQKLISTGVKYPRWRGVVDPGNGAQSDVMPFVLKSLGIEVIELNASVQGQFFARDTEVEADFEGLKELVVKEKVDFGVGYDSDGDRVVFVDERGNFIPGDYTCSLIARGSLGKVIITPINSSQVVDHIGKKVIRTKVGSPYVVEAMKKYGATFGFEGNGGGVFSDMHSRDGGRMTIEVLNVMAKEEKRLSELISTLPKFYIVKDKVQYEWEQKNKILERAKQEFKGAKVDELDGLKIWTDDTTWILFRSSMNAPEFRVFVESGSEAKSKELLTRGLELVKSVIRND